MQGQSEGNDRRKQILFLLDEWLHVDRYLDILELKRLSLFSGAAPRSMKKIEQGYQPGKFQKSPSLQDQMMAKNEIKYY